MERNLFEVKVFKELNNKSRYQRMENYQTICDYINACDCLETVEEDFSNYSFITWKDKKSGVLFTARPGDVLIRVTKSAADDTLTVYSCPVETLLKFLSLYDPDAEYAFWTLVSDDTSTYGTL